MLANDEKIVELLLINKCNSQVKNRDNKSANDLALEMNPSNANIIQLFNTHATKNSPFQSAKDLPILQGWLEKKRTNKPHTYQKQWVAVTKESLLWDKEKKTVYLLSIHCTV